MDNSNDRIPGLPEKEANQPNVFKRVENHVQSKTLGGLMELVPLLVTFIAIAFIISKADGFVRPLAFVEGRPWDFPGVGLIAAIVLFYLVGLLITNRLGRTVMEWKNTILNAIPVVKTVYGVTQQAATSMTSQYRFTRVVFLEWPREGMLAIGFVTGRAFSEGTDQSIVVIYIPTVPNPTSGNLAFVNEDDVMETDLTVEDAMKLVFSGGIVLPPSVSTARLPRQRGERELVGRFTTDPG